MRRSKIILYIIGLFILSLAVFSLAHAFSLSDYQAGVKTAEQNYTDILNSAQADYLAAITQASSDQTAAMQQASSQLAAKSITQDQYDAKMTKIQSDYESAMESAQQNFNRVRNQAFQDYQSARKSNWNQYLDITTPPPPASDSLIVSRQDLKSAAINAIVNYFVGSVSSKLSTVQLKDLLNVYLASSGSNVVLSGSGRASGQKLIDIYNKAKNNNALTPGGSGPAPSGELGSKTNPYKLNQPDSKGLGYTGSFSNVSDFQILTNAKVYFEVDPISVGVNSTIIIMNVMGYGAGLNFYYLIVDRATGNMLVPETQIWQNNSLGVNIWNRAPYTFDKVKYIYAVENPGPSALIKVFWAN